MSKKMTLGKGIASLIQASSGYDSPVDNEVVAGAYVNHFGENKQPPQVATVAPVVSGVPMMVSVDQIITNPNQPRKIFKERELEELANSIRENGVIQPLIVAEAAPENSGGKVKFELIAGERRLRASILAGLDQVPVVVKRGTEREKMVMAIIENVQRADLNCVEEALAYYQLIEDYKLTQEDVAKKIGKERSTVANFLRILKLPRKVIELLQKDLLSFGHAKVLAAVPDRDVAMRLADLTVTKNISVRELEKLVKKEIRKTSKKPSSGSAFFDEKLDKFKQQLEQKTGFHFEVASKNGTSGDITIKFNNEAEFNDIYQYLLGR